MTHGRLVCLRCGREGHVAASCPRPIILQHRGSPTAAQRACRRAGIRVTIGQVRRVLGQK